MSDDPLYEPLRDAIRWELFRVGCADQMITAADARERYDACVRGEAKMQGYLSADWNAIGAATAALRFMRRQQKSAKQQQADEIVAQSARADHGLGCLDTPDGWGTGYLDWEPDDECATVDGRCSAEILIAIGNHMLANAKRKDQGR